MSLLHIIGYVGALFIGFTLGLLGGGGALLSIPLLVYVFKVDASIATGYSLFLIGVTALSGAVQNIRKKFVDYDAALYYGIPSIITIYSVRRYLMPNLPKTIMQIGSYTLDKNHFILSILSVVMFLAAYKMITSANSPNEEKPHHPLHRIRLMMYAVVIGFFLGLVGSGGGFLVVPALIYFANVPTKKAIGTSLVIVTANSFIGFAGDLGSNIPFNWQFLLIFSAFSITGVLIGHYVAEYIHANKLKSYFGWFILAVAIFIIVKEFFLR